MADENWQKMREIFDNALCQKPEERQNYIIEVCGDDKTLLTEVKSLLSSLDSADSFMETPAVAKVASVIDAEAKKLERGKCFGHYEIIEQIGAGGMGEVYLAKDTKLDRHVAVKILNVKFSGNESNLQRFFAEAKAASGLNHPNILTIYEFGEAEDAHYIVSEFIEGVTLREIIGDSKLSLAEILDISIQIAGALSTAHTAHLVHRDIKPENIMIRPDGYVKILDFGLAKLIQPKQALAGLETDIVPKNETAKGVILGTINYMSPEQAKGERVDERTDVFSFGAVIYEMIAGRTPFQGDTISETFANLLNAEPQPMERFASDVPAELKRVVLKMLRKEKTERYQTMKELSADLKNLRENLSLEEKLERPTLPGGENATAILQVTTGDVNKKTAETNNSFSLTIKRHKSLAAFALAALFVGAIGLGYYFFNRSKAPLVFQAGQITRLTSSGRVKAAAVSPDGKFTIYAQEENNEQQSLWIQHIGSESNLQIAPPADIDFRSLTISPDSNSIYYHDLGGTLYRMAVLGGTPKKVADKLLQSPNYPGEQISISPDSKQIAFVRKLENSASAVFIADADGTNERILASFELPDTILQVSEWSPDGKVIACLLLNNGSANILAIQVADGTSSPILQGWNEVRFTWMPDSKSLIMLGKQGNDDTSQTWQIPYPSGEGRQITNDTKDYEKITLTSDGRFLAAVITQQVAEVWTMPVNDAGHARQLTAGFEKYDGASFLGWMPDGKIVYDSTASGKVSVWAMAADGSNSRQLIKDVHTYTFSPDGRYLVSLKLKGDTTGLWRTDLKDGSEKQLTKGVDVFATFSPDGKWIVYTAFDERITISRVSVEGGEPKIIYDNNGINQKVSPDGKTIAFTDEKKIKLVSFESGEIIKKFETKVETREYEQNLEWTPDGRGIYFIALNNGASNIWRQPIDGSPPVQVTKFETGRIFNFAYSPDGKQLALSRGSLNSDVVLIKNSE